VIVVIGTPVDERLNPRFTLFKELFDEFIDMIHPNQHVILRSTVYPGTTELIIRYLKSKGKEPKVSLCPERIAQGRAMEELQTLPQIVASADKIAMDEAARLFRLLTDDILYLSPIEAEMAKLFTNVWRYIQFAIANQYAAPH
jgi:UDP-N-acetyl-D-mannosaminuronic acid dehydrogenase